VQTVIGQPAYRQLADDLRSKISAGEYPIGAPIPSTSQLCELYKVSATVARAAVAELRSDGIVQGQPGKAVYVVGTPETVDAERVDLGDVQRRVDGLGKKVGKLARQIESTPAGLQQLQDDLGELRRQTALIETHLMDLYARLGQAYPHKALPDERTAPTSRRAKRASGT
jgi:DNA-binding GntR family transcriptional regulator